jgi:dihydroorotase
MYQFLDVEEFSPVRVIATVAKSYLHSPTPKIFMGSAHGHLLVEHEAELEPIFAKGKRLIAVPAEDQARINQRRNEFADITDPAIHSTIQDNKAALNATLLALKLSTRY